MMDNFKYSYDSRFDVLYIAIADKSNSYGDSVNDSIVITRDMDTGVVTGAIIYDFKKIFADKLF